MRYTIAGSIVSYEVVWYDSLANMCYLFRIEIPTSTSTDAPSNVFYNYHYQHACQIHFNIRCIALELVIDMLNN
jgi:hypothetical protein